MPPTWARHSDAEQRLEKVAETFGEGFCAPNVKAWRRKFVWFPADSERPPFYGSFSKTRYVQGPSLVQGL